ncbi:MAG: TIGR04086 family membrane protein [Pseudoflavonifractor sp.]
MVRKNEEEHGARLVRYVVGVLLGGLLGLTGCCLFLLGISLCIAQGWLGENIMYQLAVVGCVLGGFVGGTFAVRRCGSRALIVGLLTGAVQFLLLLTMGLLCYDGIAPETGGIGLLCGGLCGGAAAGILGGKPKKKRRK